MWGYMDAFNMFQDLPQDPRGVYVETNCYPWFGSVPRLALATDGSDTYIFFNFTTTFHGYDATTHTDDGVTRPSYNKQMPGVPCPVNTYNDRCAHYHRYTALDASVPPYDAASLAAAQPRCMPCEAGFHTGGLTVPLLLLLLLLLPPRLLCLHMP